MANEKNIDKLLDEMVNNNLQRRGTNPNRAYSRYIAPTNTSTMGKGGAVNYVGDYAKGNYPKFRGNGYIYGNPEVNKNLDILLKNKQDIGEIARDAVKTGGKAGAAANGIGLGSKIANVGKGAARLLPYVDAGIYAGQAYNDFKTGHPLIGTGQAALAIGDALFDTAGLIAGATSGGTGYIGQQALKKAGKAAIEAGGKKALKWMAKQAGLKPAIARMGTSIGLELGKELGEDDSNITGTSKMSAKKTGNQQSTNQQQTTGSTPIQGAIAGTVPSGSMDDFVRQLVASNGVGQDTVPQYEGGQPIEGQSLKANQPTEGLDIDGIAKLLEYYNQQKELRKPYLEGLENFANNYNDYNRQAFNMDRYLAGIAGWSGNQNFAKMMGRYNPVKNEASRLDLMNKLVEEQTKELGLGNQAIGNAAILQEAGLPVEAMWADPSIVKNAASIMNARTSAAARRYVADQTYKAKMYDTYLDNKIRQESAAGRDATARYLANLREQNRYNIAVLQAQAYGGIVGALSGTTKL